MEEEEEEGALPSKLNVTSRTRMEAAMGAAKKEINEVVCSAAKVSTEDKEHTVGHGEAGETDADTKGMGMEMGKEREKTHRKRKENGMEQIIRRKRKEESGGRREEREEWGRRRRRRRGER